MSMGCDGWCWGLNSFVCVWVCCLYRVRWGVLKWLIVYVWNFVCCVICSGCSVFLNRVLCCIICGRCWWCRWRKLSFCWLMYGGCRVVLCLVVVLMYEV